MNHNIRNLRAFCLVTFALFINTYLSIANEITFSRLPQSSGINLSGPTFGNPTWVDFDNDDYIDIFVINHGNRPSLLKNNQNETFTDVLSSSKINIKGDRHGAAWGDYNNDGNADLFITYGAKRGESVGQKQDRLFQNNGDGVFMDITIPSGTANSFGRGRSVNWVDYNNDSFIDLFIKNAATSNILYKNNGDGTFTNVAHFSGIADAPGEISSWADYNNDGYLDVFITGVGNDQLWKNNGDDSFSDVSILAGLRSLKKGKGIGWGDYNNDGYLDLYIARGFDDGGNSPIWDSSIITFSNQEDDSENGFDFVTSGDTISLDLYLDGCHSIENIMIGAQKNNPATIPFTLIRTDGIGRPIYISGQDLGFFVWSDEDRWHVRWSSDGELRYFYGVIRSNDDIMSVIPLNQKNTTNKVISTLYENNGDGTFTDVTNKAGVGNTGNNRGVVWGDFDNDGYLDIYIVNSGSILGNKPNTLYKNDGNGGFVNVAKEAGVRAHVEGRGDGAAWGDYNNDGFIDLLIVNGWDKRVLSKNGSHECLVYGPHILYKNNGNSNKWIKIKLIGSASNRDAIGSKVSLTASNLLQYREVNGGGGGQYFSQGGGPVHFGLGSAERLDTLIVQWPSGLKQEINNLGANQQITVVEGQSVAVGKPIYRPGIDLGYYIWLQPEGVWQIRWSGDGTKRFFDGTITSDSGFTEVTPINFNDYDRYSINGNTIEFHAFTSTYGDGLQLRASGSEIKLDLKVDGIHSTKNVFIGKYMMNPGTFPLILDADVGLLSINP